MSSVSKEGRRCICSWVARHGKSLEEVFALIDTDGSGDLDVGEFRAGMLQMGLAFCDEEIEALMHVLDADGGTRSQYPRGTPSAIPPKGSSTKTGI